MSHVSRAGSAGRTVVRWSFILCLNVAILLLVGVSTIRETYQGWKVDQEIDTMRAEANALEGRRAELANLIQQLNSPEVIDREARERLDLRKPNERVVVVDPQALSSSTVNLASPDLSESSASNPRKWFAYFFGISL